METVMQQPSTSKSNPAPLRPWEEILRDIQRAWSEAYQLEHPVLPQTAPVPVPSGRQPGC
jgi:hypothetical protein